MTKEFEALMELYLDQIKKVSKKPELTPADDETVKKAFDGIERIKECCKEDDEEYSMRYGMSPHPVSMNYQRMPSIPESRMYDGYSERRGRNQRNGQYMSRGHHDETVQRMIDKLDYMRMDAPDDETRRAIDLCIDKLEKR